MPERAEKVGKCRGANEELGIRNQERLATKSYEEVDI